MRGPRSLVEWAENNLAPKTSLLVLVDQFEELFRYRDYAGREEAEAFVSLILESAKAENVPIYVTLTMRSEYLGACTLIEGLAEAINRGQYLTPRLTRDETRRAITGPAGVCDFTISPGLVTRLLNDLDGFAPWEEGEDIDQLNRLVRRADQLPLLQHALNRMFTLAQSEPGGREPLVLTVADYERIGGLKGTIDGQASEILAELGEARLPVVEAMFRALTTGTTIADAVRRPTPLRELVEITGGRRDDVVAVVDAFSAHGRNLLQAKSSGDLTDDTVIDISHESLIRQWSRLSEWLRKEADAASAWRRLQEASNLHRSGRGNLLEDLNLANVAEWWDREVPSKAWAARYGGRFDEVAAFLAASREHDRREREREAALEREAQEAKLRAAEQERMLASERALAARRLQRRTLGIASILAIVALIALGASGVGWYSYARAEEAQRAAELAAARAQASEQLAQQNAADRQIALESAQTAASLYRIYEARILIAHALETLQSDPDAGRSDLALPLQLVLASLPSSDDPDSRLLPLAMGELKRIVQAIDADQLDTVQPSILEPPGIQLAHTNEVNDADISADGTLVATASEDGSMRLWSTETGETLRTFDFAGMAASGVAFSPDGSLLVVGLADFTARVFEVETGNEIVALTGHSGRVRAVAWSPDGSRIATGSDDGTARIWSVDGAELATLQGHTDWVRSIAYSPDGTMVATGSDDQTIRVWSAASGETMQVLRGHTDWVRAVAFSPNGRLIASGADDGTVRLWSTASFTEVRNIKAAPSHYVFGVAFSPDSQLVASGATDNLVRLWSADTGASVLDFSGHQNTVYSVAFSGDGRHLVSGSADFTAIEWSVETGAMERTFGGRPPDVAALAFDATGMRLATGSSDATLRLWSVGDQTVLQSVRGTAGILSVAYAPGRDVIAAAANDNSVRLYAADGTLLHELPHDDWVRSMAFSPDGTRLATGSDDKTVRIWDVDSGTLLQTMQGHRDWVRSVAYAPDGRSVLSGSDDGTARLWSADTGEQIRSFEGGHNGYIYSVAFSPDGESIATGGDDYAIVIWSVRDGAQQQRMIANDGTIFSLAFSPAGGGDLLSLSGTVVQLWSVATGAEHRSFRPEGLNAYYSTAFAPDGSAVAIGGSDGLVRVFPLRTAEEILTRGFEIAETLPPLDQGARCDYLIDITAAQCDAEARAAGGPVGGAVGGAGTGAPPT